MAAGGGTQIKKLPLPMAATLVCGQGGCSPTAGAPRVGDRQKSLSSADAKDRHIKTERGTSRGPLCRVTPDLSTVDPACCTKMGQVFWLEPRALGGPSRPDRGSGMFRTARFSQRRDRTGFTPVSLLSALAAAAQADPTLLNFCKHRPK